MKTRHIIRNIAIAELGLLIPLLGMQLSDSLQWGAADFVTGGILLAGIGFAAELVRTGLRSSPQRVVVGLILALGIALLLAELAVGLFGSPIAGS